MIKNLAPGAADSNPSEFTVIGGRTYFVAYVGGQPALYVTNGTATGTKRLRTFVDAWGLKAVGNRLYLLADDGAHGLEPWTSDGTKAGTTMVKDIVPGSGGSAITVFAGGSAYWFAAEDGTHGGELWRATGPSSASMVKDVNDGPGTAFGMSGGAAFGSKVIFDADDGVHGFEPWISGGTKASTRMVKDIRPS